MGDGFDEPPTYLEVIIYQLYTSVQMYASNMNTRITAAVKPSPMNGPSSLIIEQTKLSTRWNIHHEDNSISTTSTGMSPQSPVTIISKEKMQHPTSCAGILKKHTVPKDVINSNAKRSRKVRFHHGNNNKHKEVAVEVIPIELIKSPRIKSRLWYTARDIAMMIERDATILLLMDMGYTDETLVHTDSKAALLLSKYSPKEIEEMTTRGLERQSKKGIKRFQTVSRASIAAVLQCQHTNRSMHTYYRMECIASAYAMTTQESQQLSLRRAKLDAKFVREHCNIQNCTMELLRQLQQQAAPTFHHISSNGNKKSLTTTTTSLLNLFYRPATNHTMGQ